VGKAKAEAEAAAKAAQYAANARRAALEHAQEQVAAQKNAAWVQAYAEQLEDEDEDVENDRSLRNEEVEPVPDERLGALRVTFAQLKSCAAAAKQDGQADKQRQLGRHISALAEEIGFIERRRFLMPGWDEPDALSEAQKVLDRFSRQINAGSEDD
jgi:hypothetical protein